MAVSTSGFIRFNGTNYEGDCETTSDILGPFYRPNSPVRTNLVIKGMQGQLVELSGSIRHNDCKTPYKKAKVEIWHCNNEGIYDNSSDDFVIGVPHILMRRGNTLSKLFSLLLMMPADLPARTFSFDGHSRRIPVISHTALFFR